MKNTSKHFRLAFMAVLFGLAARSSDAANQPNLLVQAAEQPPNAVVILADDLGYEDLGLQGSTRIKTPHLDRLSAMGTRFTDGHVSASVCSPSRAGLMTGRYQQRFGHEGNTPRRPFGMDTQERTMGQAFQSLGYRTAIFGKWHLGDEDKHYPTNRGSVNSRLDNGCWFRSRTNRHAPFRWLRGQSRDLPPR